MIVQFLAHGAGGSKGPINYILNDKDSNNKTREPLPKILSGDPDITSMLIDMNKRKFKYTSCVLAFRDSENPTDKQIKDVLKDFRNTFVPGLGPDRVDMLQVLHRDKGNTEIHIIIPMVEIKSGRQFNINPPGKHAQQLSRDFQAFWNDRLGYDQVVPDPFKVQLSKFDYVAKKLERGIDSKTDDRINKSSTRVKIKQTTSEIFVKAIKSGKVKNRDELVSLIKSKGINVTRQGDDYISIKFEGQEKATRFKGEIFKKDANYPVLIKQYANMDSGKKLTSFELVQVKNRIIIGANYRKQFNNKAFEIKPKRITTGGGSKPKINLPSIPSFNTQQKSKPISTLNTDMFQKKNKNKIKPVSNKNSQNSAPSSSSNVGKLDRTFGVNKSLASLQGQIDAASADLANATTLEDRIRAEQKLQELMAQRNRLLADLEEAKKAELNDQDFTRTRRPKIR